MSGLLVLMGFLGAVLDCGCTPKRPLTAKALPPQVTTAVYPTIEEAAVGAWDFQEPDLPSEIYPAPGNGYVDRAATSRLWKSRPEMLEEKTVDLNGDGTGEVLLYNGRFVGMDGKELDSDGGQGANRLWAVIQKVADGWRVVGCGWGHCPPDVQAQVTNGWKNLTSHYHFRAGQGTEYLYQFDGTRYKLTKETEYEHGDPPSRRTASRPSEA
jgi:hypothetical protein